MNDTHKLLLALSLVLIVGCDQKEVDAHIEKRKARVWMESSLGVEYFYDCIDGLKFIVVSKRHGFGIAGPLGECE